MDSQLSHMPLISECKNKCAQSFALNTVPETEATRIGLDSETLIEHTFSQSTHSQKTLTAIFSDKELVRQIFKPHHWYIKIEKEKLCVRQERMVITDRIFVIFSSWTKLGKDKKILTKSNLLRSFQKQNNICLHSR